MHMEQNEEMEKIAQGAEAVLYANKEQILKQRISKGYRHPELDMLLRKTRTRKEARVIEKIQSLKLPGPKLLSMCDREMKIKMEFIKGDLLVNFYAKWF